MGIDKRISKIFTAIMDRIDDILDCRDVWRDKNASTRFKVLNSISGGWLRFNISKVKNDAYRLGLYLESVSDYPEDVTPEQYERAVAMALKHLKRLDESLNEFFHI